MTDTEKKELFIGWIKERKKKLKMLNKNKLIDMMLKLELSIISNVKVKNDI